MKRIFWTFVTISVTGFVAFGILWNALPAVNIYQSISTGQIVKVQTRDGMVTNQAEIAKVLSGRYDGHTFYVP